MSVVRLLREIHDHVVDISLLSLQVPLSLDHHHLHNNISTLYITSSIDLYIPIMKCRSSCRAHRIGMSPANKSAPFLYTNRLTTTIVTVVGRKGRGVGVGKFKVVNPLS